MAASTPSMQGKVCLVTGATSGIGRVTAQALAQQETRVVEIAERVVLCFPAQGSDHRIDERLNGGQVMGIFRMYTGADGKSVIEELSQDDPILETLKTCTGCSLQVNAPSEFSDFHPAPRRRWMTMISGQIDIQLADGTIHSFGPEDLRLWEDVTGQGHRTRFPVPSVSISMPLPD